MFRRLKRKIKEGKGVGIDDQELVPQNNSNKFMIGDEPQKDSGYQLEEQTSSPTSDIFSSLFHKHVTDDGSEHIKGSQTPYWHSQDNTLFDEKTNCEDELSYYSQEISGRTDGAPSCLTSKDFESQYENTVHEQWTMLRSLDFASQSPDNTVHEQGTMLQSLNFASQSPTVIPRTPEDYSFASQINSYFGCLPTRMGDRPVSARDISLQDTIAEITLFTDHRNSYVNYKTCADKALQASVQSKNASMSDMVLLPSSARLQSILCAPSCFAINPNKHSTSSLCGLQSLNLQSGSKCKQADVSDSAIPLFCRLTSDQTSVNPSVICHSKRVLQENTMSKTDQTVYVSAKSIPPSDEMKAENQNVDTEYKPLNSHCFYNRLEGQSTSMQCSCLCLCCIQRNKNKQKDTTLSNTTSSCSTRKTLLGSDANLHKLKSSGFGSSVSVSTQATIDESTADAEDTQTSSCKLHANSLPCEAQPTLANKTIDVESTNYVVTDECTSMGSNSLSKLGMSQQSSKSTESKLCVPGSSTSIIFKEGKNDVEASATNAKADDQVVVLNTNNAYSTKHLESSMTKIDTSHHAEAASKVEAKDHLESDNINSRANNRVESSPTNLESNDHLGSNAINTEANDQHHVESQANDVEATLRSGVACSSNSVRTFANNASSNHRDLSMRYAIPCMIFKTIEFAPDLELSSIMSLDEA